MNEALSLRAILKNIFSYFQREEEYQAKIRSLEEEIEQYEEQVRYIRVRKLLNYFSPEPKIIVFSVAHRRNGRGLCQRGRRPPDLRQRHQEPAQRQGGHRLGNTETTDGQDNHGE